MSAIVDLFTVIATGAGAIFFLGGSIGLIRFPDSLSRLHALSKADNLGLGLVVIGLLPQATSISSALKLIAIWLLAQLSAATTTQLLAGIARHRERDP